MVVCPNKNGNLRVNEEFYSLLHGAESVNSHLFQFHSAISLQGIIVRVRNRCLTLSGYKFIFNKQSAGKKTFSGEAIPWAGQVSGWTLPAASFAGRQFGFGAFVCH